MSIAEVDLVEYLAIPGKNWEQQKDAVRACRVWKQARDLFNRDTPPYKVFDDRIPPR